ncbi:hypothetical protein [Nonomuraea salmonea]|uniref:hypothetical protein n=1 Tax=Nonomuraea salmonea TaxID=46181 RepID=UPI002FE8E180
MRSIDALTASASSGLPVWKVTPERSVNVQVRPSAEERHEVARRGADFLVTGFQ